MRAFTTFLYASTTALAVCCFLMACYNHLVGEPWYFAAFLFFASLLSLVFLRLNDLRY